MANNVNGNSTTPCTLLNSGHKIPLIGLGMAAHSTPDDVVKNAVLEALKAGYRHFDTAALYGSERALGMALKEAFSQGLVKREHVFVTSKIWCTDLHPDDVLPALHKTLKETGLDYLDLYLIHWPVRFKKEAPYPELSPDSFLPLDIPATWKAMEKCVEKGLAKSIGISNFSIKKTKELLASAKIPPAVNQVEMHPMWNQKSLREFCKNNEIHVTAYSPLGAPIGAPLLNFVHILKDPNILSIASKHGKTASQVLLRWGIEEGVSVIPKSCNGERIRENIKIFDFNLGKDDKKTLNNMEQRKVITGKEYVNPKGGPYHSLFELWDEEVTPSSSE